jgi:hypothetical protein
VPYATALNAKLTNASEAIKNNLLILNKFCDSTFLQIQLPCSLGAKLK